MGKNTKIDLRAVIIEPAPCLLTAEVVFHPVGKKYILLLMALKCA
jgi:hypothetical protein